MYVCCLSSKVGFLSQGSLHFLTCISNDYLSRKLLLSEVTQILHFQVWNQLSNSIKPNLVLCACTRVSWLEYFFNQSIAITFRKSWKNKVIQKNDVLFFKKPFCVVKKKITICCIFMLHIVCSCKNQTLCPIEFLRRLFMILPNAKYCWPLCHVSICTCNQEQAIKVTIYCSRN